MSPDFLTLSVSASIPRQYLGGDFPKGSTLAGILGVFGAGVVLFRERGKTGRKEDGCPIKSFGCLFFRSGEMRGFMYEQQNVQL